MATAPPLSGAMLESGAMPHFGDLVSRTTFGPMRHYGVYLGRFGGHADAVLDLDKNNLRPGVAAVRVSPLAQFARGRRVRVHAVRAIDPERVSRRARRLCSRGRVTYGLLGVRGWGGNCEHVARWVVTGTARSVQVSATVVGVAAVSALVLLQALVSL